MPNSHRPVVAIVGAGFGGLRAARALRHAPVDVVLIDRTNYHLFQPLLYQVATAALPPNEKETGKADQPSGEPPRVGLALRAYPLLKLLEAAAAENCAVSWRGH